jgi:hypothetical protein
MDRRVDTIISEWRELERQYEAATDDETREYLEARIAELREEHHQAVEERMPADDEPPELGGALRASA